MLLTGSDSNIMQSKNSDNKNLFDDPIFKLLFGIVGIGVVLGVFVIFGVVEGIQAISARVEQASLAYLSSLTADDIEKIEFYEYDSALRGKVGEVNNRESIREFLAAMKRVEPYFPNHPHHKERFYVVMPLKDGTETQFLFYFERFVNEAHIEFYGIKGSSNWFAGDAKSKELYDWMVDQRLIDPKTNMLPTQP